MESLKSKILLICFFTIAIYIMLCKVTYAASMNMSISKTSGYVGDTFSVTISGINGSVYISSNSNISINTSGRQFVDGSLTITGTAKSIGTGTITVTPEDAVTDAAEPEEVTASASRSITIKQKELEQQPMQVDSVQTSTSQTTATKSKTTTAKSKTTTTEQKEEITKKSENFFISTLVLNGINNKGEYIEIKLNPEFNKEVYEYECNIGHDIDKIEIQKDAGEFTDSIVITGMEEIKEGENVVKVELIEEGYETKTYTIKIIKDSEEIVENDNQNTLETNQDKGKLIISMPFWIFTVMEIAIIIIEAILICFLDKRSSERINKKH